MKIELLAAAAALALTTIAAPATAGTLLNVTDQDGTTSYSFAVTATSASTDFDFAGYNLPSFIDVSDISVSADSAPGTNLLGPAWTLTRAPAGSDTYTYNDGTPVPALAFGSVVIDSYDTYSQTVATTPGNGYHVAFTYTNSRDPSGLIVSAGTVPEPATWALMIGGFGLVGASLRRRTAALAA